MELLHDPSGIMIKKVFSNFPGSFSFSPGTIDRR